MSQMITTKTTTVRSWVNGEPSEFISVFDRGLQYGDGFFTSILVVGNHLLNWSAHWRRIQNSANQLQFSALDESLLLQQISQAVAAQEDSAISKTQIIKVVVTRGAAGRGYQIPETSETVTMIQLSDAPIQVESHAGSETVHLSFPEPQALRLEVCSTQASIQTQLAGVKHLNRLDNVLARTEVVNQGLEEALMLNGFGYVVSATQSNLFMIKDNMMITPKLDQSGVEGTTRYQLSQVVADLGYSWQEADITLQHVQQADELFLTNAVRGIMPISHFKEGRLSISQSMKIHQVWTAWQAENALCLDSLKDKT